jgi:hypothetical protein
MPMPSKANARQDNVNAKQGKAMPCTQARPGNARQGSGKQGKCKAMQGNAMHVREARQRKARQGKGN